MNVDDIMRLNDAERMVEREYFQLSEKYPYIVCHEHAVMPNHFHCIIQIMEDTTICQTVGAPLVGAHTRIANIYQGTHKGCPYGGHIPPTRCVSLWMRWGNRREEGRINSTFASRGHGDKW